jgi:signal transduction histidine kinase
MAENVRVAIGDAATGRRFLATTFYLDGEEPLAGVVLRDITDLERFEEMRRRSMRVEMIRRLAGGIAQNLNNLLTTIMGNASLMIEDADAGQRVKHAAREIVACSERAAQLTRHMLAFSGQRMYVTDVQLPVIVQEVENKFRSLLPDSVVLIVDVEPVPSLTADPSQIADLLEILFRNALEATEERLRGRIDIRVGMFRGSVCLEVKDDGCGIIPGDLPRIFEPFFTTKFVGRGLGLAAAEGIATACSGQIEVESSPGAGTTIRVIFPASRSSVAVQ